MHCEWYTVVTDLSTEKPSKQSVQKLFSLTQDEQNVTENKREEVALVFII